MLTTSEQKWVEEEEKKVLQFSKVYRAEKGGN
jgi:hypothetical protein